MSADISNPMLTKALLEASNDPTLSSSTDSTDSMSTDSTIRFPSAENLAKKNINDNELWKTGKSASITPDPTSNDSGSETAPVKTCMGKFCPIFPFMKKGGRTKKSKSKKSKSKKSKSKKSKSKKSKKSKSKKSKSKKSKKTKSRKSKKC